MILETGDMWQIFNRTDLFCITTNSCIKRNGRLVMGKGIALQAKNKLPEIDFYFAQKIRSYSTYGLVVIDDFKPQLIGAFQTKVDWRDNSPLSLITYSIQMLRKYLITIKPNRVDLPFPGVNNGGLNKEKVLPFLISLPDNVHVWSYE